MSAQRKLIQITAIAPGRDAYKGYSPQVVGLAEDGTVWSITINPVSHEWMYWKRLPDLPASDADADAQLVEWKQGKRTKLVQFFKFMFRKK